MNNNQYLFYLLSFLSFCIFVYCIEKYNKLSCEEKQMDKNRFKLKILFFGILTYQFYNNADAIGFNKSIIVLISFNLYTISFLSVVFTILHFLLIDRSVKINLILIFLTILMYVFNYYFNKKYQVRYN